MFISNAIIKELIEIIILKEFKLVLIASFQITSDIIFLVLF